MNIIDSILQRMVGVSQAQKKFLVILFSTILLAYGKVNFTNLSRYSSLGEKTYRRHFLKSFNFPQFNQLFLQSAFSHPNTLIAVIDCSFLKKSGKKTAGKDYFFNSIAGKVDDYIKHLRNTRTFCPESVRYLVADGYYYRSKFCSAVRDLNLEFIGKLRTDANLRYLYTGEQNKRGAPRKYDGKVDFNDLSRFTFVKEIETGVSLYTAVVWSCCLNCQIRLVYISDTRANRQPKFALLFSTDIHLDAEKIFEYYQARFQIEFIFRDAKQFTGLSDCQSPHSQRLDFHFNASLTALNLAKYQAYSSRSSTSHFVFSMASFKRLEFNHHLLLTFIDKFDLDPNLILNHPNLPSVLSYGTLAA